MNDPSSDSGTYFDGYNQGWKDCWQFLQNFFMPPNFFENK